MDSRRALDIQVIYLRCIKKATDCPQVDEKGETQGKHLSLKLRKLLKRNLDLDDVEVNLVKVASVSSSSSSRLYFEEDSVIHRFQGKLFLMNFSQTSVRRLMQRFVEQDDCRGLYLSLGSSGSDSVFAQLLTPSDSVKVNSFSLGSIVDLNIFVSHYLSKKQTEDGLKVAKDDLMGHFQHDKGRLLVSFRASSGAENVTRFNPLINHKYQMIVMYSNIQSIILAPGVKEFRVYLILGHPPLLYEVEPYIAKDLESKLVNKLKSENIHTDETIADTWVRVNHFHGIKPSDYGKCHVLRLSLPQVLNNQVLRDDGDKKVTCPWSLLSSVKWFAELQTPLPVYFASIEEIVCSGQGSLLKEVPKSLPFNVCYAMASVLSASHRLEDELIRKCQKKIFWEKVVQFSKENSSALEETLFEIFHAIDRHAFIRVLGALEAIFRERKRCLTKKDGTLCQGVKKIRRAILTPTRLLILPPQPFMSSRFIRDSDSDFALRVSFRDDDQQSLTFTACNQGSTKRQKDFLYEVIKKPIEKGLTIGNRVYKFLGSSSSQLRDHGMILYANDEKGRTADSIRESIGSVNKIRNVPKYIARVGLAFSQAMTHILVEQECVRYVPDVKGGKHPVSGNVYTFSDGVGMVSEALAREVCLKLRRPQANGIPSAYQIRYAGCKGLLVVNPFLKGRQVIFRDSMNKFPSQSTSLDILKLSEARPVYLNRPLITLMEQLDVPPEIFLKMQMKTLQVLTNAFLCEIDASRLIKAYSSLQSIVPSDHLVNSGINILNEPFFRKCLDTLVKRGVNDLKMKARIKVPFDSGRIMFGVFDDTGKLEYGQIFVQYTVEDNPSEKKVLLGTVLVTKYPCMVPGDVRKFQAMDIPALRHIYNCIVFPSKGPRPHPDEMAGSDLDGDEYSVIWYKPLLFPGENKKPMDFPDTKCSELNREVKVDDILDFYVSFIQTNCVGIIANSHLAFADWLKKGVYDEKCLDLAKKYATALDFAKSGENEHLSARDRPYFYPDFMHKFSEKPSYLSKRTLGLLYRQVSLFELCMNEELSLEVNCEKNPLLVHRNWKMYKGSAINAYLDYHFMAESILKQFGIEDESALLTNAFVKSSKYNAGKKEATDCQEMVEVLVKNMFRHFRDMFDLEFRDELKYKDSLEDKEDDRMAKASAWYVMTYELNRGKETSFYGLPWTVSHDLALLATKRKMVPEEEGGGQKPIPVTQAMDESIELVDKLLEENSQLSSEDRIEKAIDVLTNWLKFQKHLQLGIRNSEIELKYRINSILGDIHCYDQVNPEAKRLSVGSIVIKAFKEMVEVMFNPDVNDNTSNALGLSALMTLNRFYRTRMSDHILPTEASIGAQPCLVAISSFHLSLSYDDAFCRLVNQDRAKFLKFLKEVSGVRDIVGQPYQQGGSYWYLLITAVGTKWNLIFLQNIIAQPTFYKDAVAGKLTLKG